MNELGIIIIHRKINEIPRCICGSKMTFTGKGNYWACNKQMKTGENSFKLIEKRSKKNEIM